MTSTRPPPGGDGTRPGSTRPEGARVLVVDDEAAERRGIARHLMARGFQVDTAEDARAALDLLASRRADVVLLDLGMPGMRAEDAIRRVAEAHPDVPVIALAEIDALDAAVRAVRAGAYDYLIKSLIGPDTAGIAVERAAERRELRERARALTQELEHHEGFGEIVGSSSAMREVERRANAAARGSSPVLLLGERGTGKDLLARAIHRGSSRAGGPLRVVSCGALAEDVLEADLFGGARPGALEEAEGGTVLLDDVGDLARATQARLSRALAGSSYDVRVIATAGSDLRSKLAAGEFREELFYRLAVVLIEIPPLRQRKEDIPLLAYHFLRRAAPRSGREIRRISVEALRRLRDHRWPGNVRELEHAIEHAVVMAKGDVILPADLPFGEGGAALAMGPLGEDGYADAKEKALGVFDKAYVDQVMERAGGNVSEAARLAGMDRSNFRRLLKKVRRKEGAEGGDED